MARITVEDCLKKVENRFELVHLAIKRVKELKKDAPPLVECDNKEIVTALREIAAGKVYPIRPEKELLEYTEKSISLPEKGETISEPSKSEDSALEVRNE